MTKLLLLITLQACLALPASAELSRLQAEAAMARITSVYQNASFLRFQMEIAQGPLGKYLIHTVHTPSYVWFRVHKDGSALYEAWAWDVEKPLSVPKGVPSLPEGVVLPSTPKNVWIVVDRNYTLGGKTAVFELETEDFYDGWLSPNDENLIACFTHAINQPNVGPRSNIVRLIDKLLGVREDLLPDREYMGPSCAGFLLKDGYIEPNFPTHRIRHCWRRKAGVARMGNEGTYVVTLAMEGNEWIVLRKMTRTGKDVTVKDTWTIDPESGLITQWDRDFGIDLPGLGRVRTRKFTYLKSQGPDT